MQRETFIAIVNLAIEYIKDGIEQYSCSALMESCDFCTGYRPYFDNNIILKYHEKCAPKGYGVRETWLLYDPEGVYKQTDINKHIATRVCWLEKFLKECLESQEYLKFEGE